ncbi:MAG TPA: peptidoglycan-binding protein [Blastocatellia bacterium]|nr:peptidoglycan-binding protein [Blastocatellia bacterium]
MNNRGVSRSLIACALLAALLATLSFAASAQQQRPRYGVRPTTDGTWTVPEDTVITVRMDSTLSSKSARIGDRFTATVDVPVYVNGATVIPAGATIEGHVTQVTPARRMARSGTMAVEFENLVLPDGTRVAIEGTLTSDDPDIRRQIDEENRVSGHKNRDTGVFVGSSGAVGAVLGGIAGGLKGAAVGGAIGAGVGIASILLSKGEDAKVPSGAPFGVHLRRALVIHTGAASDPVAAGRRDDNRYPDRRDPVATDDRYRRQPVETRPDRDPVDDRQPVDDRSARQPVDVDPDRDAEPDREPAETQPSRQPADPPDSRQPAESRSPGRAPAREDNDASAAEPSTTTAAPLPLNSPEMTHRAQAALRDEGYYEGEISDQWSPRAAGSLKTYQREHKLSETGNLDDATAKSLGILNARPVSSASPSSRPPVSRPESRPADQVVTSDRGTASANPSPAPVRPASDDGLSNLARGIQSRAGDLLAEHKRQLGMSGDRRDDGGRSVYSDADVELLFALNSFANAANLYASLIGSLHDSQSQRQATLDLARQARRTDRIIAVSTSRAANSLLPQWDVIRQDVLRVMRMFNISTSEIEN